MLVLHVYMFSSSLLIPSWLPDLNRQPVPLPPRRTGSSSTSCLPECPRVWCGALVCRAWRSAYPRCPWNPRPPPRGWPDTGPAPHPHHPPHCQGDTPHRHQYHPRTQVSWFTYLSTFQILPQQVFSEPLLIKHTLLLHSSSPVLHRAWTFSQSKWGDWNCDPWGGIWDSQWSCRCHHLPSQTSHNPQSDAGKHIWMPTLFCPTGCLCPLPLWVWHWADHHQLQNS